MHWIIENKVKSQLHFMKSNNKESMLARQVLNINFILRFFFLLVNFYQMFLQLLCHIFKFGHNSC